MSAEDKYFCSAQSRSNREFLYGTATRVRSWLLVEYPGAWRHEAIAESDLSDEVRDRLCSIGKQNRSLLIRQSHFAKAPYSCFSASSKEIGSELRRYSFSDYDDVSLPIAAAGVIEAQPVFLVCTHGNHDKCCSKFGLPVYQQLCEYAGDRVWQCSHVGGDRFAANVVCFPYGIYYGHVSLEDATKIVDAHARGEIYLKNYRGRCCYSRFDQVSEYFVRSQSGLVGVEDLRLLKSDGTAARFRSANGIHEVEFREKSGLSQILTCKSQEAKPIPQYELVRYEFRAHG